MRAFTLLECLVALLVISGSVLVMQGLTRLAHDDLLQMQNSQEKDWQSFCNQLRYELDGSGFVRTDGHFLYVKKTGNWRFGLSAQADDFRKTDDRGSGYQPMLYGVKSATITSAKGQAGSEIITIKIILTKGGEKTFIYKFSNINA